MPQKKPLPAQRQDVISVAVAVIYHKQQYLLGFRDAAQHQGDRYEFVGGKIETNEKVEQAVIREVAEETGIVLDDNTLTKLGRLHHDYGDKQVSLQVYSIELTADQYEQHKHCQYGLEGQAMTWVDKQALLAGQYPLPAANSTILEWLKLPTQITITYPLAHFSAYETPALAWLQYHHAHVAKEAWVYIRIKAADTTDNADAEHITRQLMNMRPDLRVIIPACHTAHHAHRSAATDEQIGRVDNIDDEQTVACHLTHSALMQWYDTRQEAVSLAQPLSKHYPLIVSCHDVASIETANELARSRLQEQRPPLIGAFLSPVSATQSHPDTAPLGWERWSDLAQLLDVPVIGLGGLSPWMIEQALTHGGVTVAGIREFLSPIRVREFTS